MQTHQITEAQVEPMCLAIIELEDAVEARERACWTDEAYPDLDGKVDLARIALLKKVGDLVQIVLAMVVEQ